MQNTSNNSVLYDCPYNNNVKISSDAGPDWESLYTDIENYKKNMTSYRLCCEKKQNNVERCHKCRV